MAINLAEKASPKVVERFKIKSATEGLFTSEYDWSGVATVKVYSVDNLPLNDYDKTLTTGSRFGALSEVGDTVQELTVTDDKAFNGSIDKGNNTSQLQIKAAAKVLKRQTDEVLIPYADKYRLGKLKEGAGITESVGSLTKANIVEKIMLANAAMSNANVPDDGRVLYMGYTVAVQLKLAEQVVGIDKLGEAAIVNGAMGKIDKCQIRLVPDSYMPAGTAFMIVKTGCAAAPKKIETFRILNEHPDIDGAVVQGRLLHDCFVLETKNKGIYVGTTA
jgi:hypothetical protein